MHSTDRDENGTVITRTEPHRFLYLIRSNLYFCTNSNSVQNSKHEIQNRNENGLVTFRPFSTFLLLIRNIPNSKFGLPNSKFGIWCTRSPAL
jgi:hypothetical protein